MATPLTPAEIEAALSGLPGWSHDGDQLRKQFVFGDFQEAIGFIVRLAFQSERLNHHPEIVNVYNRVELALTTHDAGNRVTERDVALAKAVESFN